MRITISKEAVCGVIPIPPADYWVSLNPSAGEIMLSAGGKDLHLKATKRRSASKTRKTVIQFYSGGGKHWSLIVLTPKQGEWIAMIEYV